MGISIGLLGGALFWGVGKFVFSQNNALNQFLIVDFLAPAFMCALDPFVVLSLGKLLASHTYLPVYVREIKSGLYQPSAYFWASTLVHELSVMFYPFILVVLGFWMWDYTDDSFNNYINYALPTLFIGEIGAMYGLLVGALVDDDT